VLARTAISLVEVVWQTDIWLICPVKLDLHKGAIDMLESSSIQLFTHSFISSFIYLFSSLSFVWRHGYHNSLYANYCGPYSGMRQTPRVVIARDLLISSVIHLHPPYNIVRVKVDGTSSFMSLSEKTRHWESKVSCRRTQHHSQVRGSKPDYWTWSPML